MRTKVAAILLFTSLAVLSPAQSFQAFRLKSGMTPEQAAQAIPTYELRWDGSNSTMGSRSAFLANSDDDIYANLLFCNNSLVGLTRSIDPDTDLIHYLQDNIREFGQPQVSIRTEAWTGTGGGDILSILYTWTRNDVKYTLISTPEGRNGKGELRYSRSSSVAFFLLTSSCKSKPKP